MDNDGAVICHGCGNVMDPTIPRVVRSGVIVSCDKCPRKRLSLSHNDRRFLKSLRIDGDGFKKGEDA